MIDTTNVLNSNRRVLCGSVPEAPRFSHVGGTENYMTFPLEIERLSGAFDRINIITRESDLEAISPGGENKVYIEGEVRSFNNKNGVGSRLVITVFAKVIRLSDTNEDINEVHLTGVLCKAPTLRKTPMGRQICDIMLAVNRKYGRSDYLPCIAWGRCAMILSERKVGDKISIAGRIQSRKYIKTTESGSEERTAFEVSVISLEEDSNPVE